MITSPARADAHRHATHRRVRALPLARDLTVVVVTFVALAVLVSPFVWVVLTSLRPAADLLTNTFQPFAGGLTLASYRALLASGFARYIGNSLFVCGTATVISVTLALLAAYSFSRKNFPGRNALLLLFALSQLFPFVVLITPIYIVFYHLGLVDTYLGLIIAYVAITLPFSVYLLVGYLGSVPRELDEAATVDGCSTVGTIIRVVLPVAWPGVVATAIYAFISAWEEFLFALTLMTSDAHKTVPLGLANFFGEYTAHWDLVMAASVITTIPTLILFLFLQRWLVSGLGAGAVKG